MSDELLDYPKGSVAMGNGDLTEVRNLKGTITNGTKFKHTLRRTPAGTTKGHRECTGTFDLSIPETGDERDYWSLVMEGTVKQLRIKLPGTTKAINVVHDKLDFELTSDDGCNYTVGFLGALVDS